MIKSNSLTLALHALLVEVEGQLALAGTSESLLLLVASVELSTAVSLERSLSLLLSFSLDNSTSTSSGLLALFLASIVLVEKCDSKDNTDYLLSRFVAQ